MIKQRLQEALNKACLTAYGDVAAPGSADIQLSRPASFLHTDYACALPMRLAAQLGIDATQLALVIADETGKQLTKFAVVGVTAPGFINLRITPEGYAQTLVEILKVTDTWDFNLPAAPLPAEAQPVGGIVFLIDKLNSITLSACEPLLDVENKTEQPSLSGGQDRADFSASLINQPQILQLMFEPQAGALMSSKSALKALAATSFTLLHDKNKQAKHTAELVTALVSLLAATTIRCPTYGITAARLAMLIATLRVLVKAQATAT